MVKLGGMIRVIVRTALTAAALILIYAVIPIPRGSSLSVGGTILFIGGVVALATAMISLIRQVGLSAGQVAVRGEMIVLLGYGILFFFSLAYLWLARSPDQFDGMDTRVDAMYFTVTTLTTVGFGDIHAAGQAARIAVTIQMIFNVVFIASAVRIVGPAIMQQRAERLRERAAGEHEG
jgi:voltage-gated potassium channel